MKKVLFSIVLISSFSACSIVSVILPHERIAGVEIMSVADLENKDGFLQREVRGIIVEPFDTDEDWYVAFQSIYSQKKIPGMNTVIKIYLEEENWELGTPYAVGKFSEDKRASINVDGRLIKVKNP